MQHSFRLHRPLYTKNSTLSDLIALTSYTTYVSGQYGGWTSKPLVPVNHTAFSTKWNTIGQTMRVVLPIKIGKKVVEYIFNFRTEFIEKKKK
jgi:hypothetical protein